MKRKKLIIGSVVFCACVFLAMMTLGEHLNPILPEIEYRLHPRAQNQLSPMTILFRRSVKGTTTVDVLPYEESRAPCVTLRGSTVHHLIADLEFNEIPHHFYFGISATGANYTFRFHRPHQAMLTFVYNPDSDTGTLDSLDGLWDGGMPLTPASKDYLNSLLTYAKSHGLKNAEAAMTSSNSTTPATPGMAVQPTPSNGIR